MGAVILRCEPWRDSKDAVRSLQPILRGAQEGAPQDDVRAYDRRSLFHVKHIKPTRPPASAAPLVGDRPPKFPAPPESGRPAGPPAPPFAAARLQASSA